MKNLVKMTLRISEKQMSRLRQVSEESGLSVTEHIRRAIDAYLALWS